MRSFGCGIPGRLRRRLGKVEPVQAEVVCAALQQGNARRAAERLRDGRQVAVEELVLKRARARGDDDLPAGQERWNQIGEGLARARARLDREHAAGCQRLADPVGHELLLAARLKSLDDARELAVRAEQPAEFAAPVHEPRVRAM
jgi:hypothetical protein